MSRAEVLIRTAKPVDYLPNAADIYYTDLYGLNAKAKVRNLYFDDIVLLESVYDSQIKIAEYVRILIDNRVQYPTLAQIREPKVLKQKLVLLVNSRRLEDIVYYIIDENLTHPFFEEIFHKFSKDPYEIIFEVFYSIKDGEIAVPSHWRNMYGITEDTIISLTPYPTRVKFPKLGIY